MSTRSRPGDEMKPLLIVEHARRRPELCHWFGSADPLLLDAALSKRRWTIPLDLRAFLVEFGGGDFLESETLLGPFVDDATGDNLFAEADSAHIRGFPSDWVLFHRGTRMSFVRQTDGMYVVSEGTPRGIGVLTAYDNMDAWYAAEFHELYAMRYGLPRLASVR